MLTLSTPLNEVCPIAPRLRAPLERLGLGSVGDLLGHFPHRYEDRRHVAAVGSLRVGETTTVHGTVRSIRPRRSRAGKGMVEAQIDDGSGSLELVWFNQPYLMEVLRPGMSVYCYGEIKLRRGLQMIAPEFEIEAVDDAGPAPPARADAAPAGVALSMQRIVPVYRTTRGVQQRVLRGMVQRVLEEEGWDRFESGPFEILVAPTPSLGDAYRSVHFPVDTAALREARNRLVFEEYFHLASRIHLRRRRFRDHRGPCFCIAGDFDAKARSLFAFEFTADQNGAIREISRDLEGPAPMYRLLQGDVGTGKTAVALYALLAAVRNGYQGALMAPTAVLAEQHHRNVTDLLKSHSAVCVVLLTGSIPAASRRTALEAISSGAAHIVIGTHALIQNDVRYRALGVAIVDEQHRFGVQERTRLRDKGSSPHLLVMSATPIPRSLCQTVYGDLDLSILKERPAGRTPVKTMLVSESQHDRGMALVTAELERGHQAYFIYPLVEQSETLDLPSAEEAYGRLCDALPGYRIGLLHGRMSAEEKDVCLRRFRDNEFQVLVSTVVVEVGIDVANATVLFVEDASRFGLAQLHQLRGRVGRGCDQGYCLVGLGDVEGDLRQRLEAFRQTDDGFRIAEEDLRLRGPGDFVGVRQSGLPVLRIGNPFTDQEGFRRVRALAAEFWDAPRHAAAARRYLERFPELEPAQEEPPFSARPASGA